MRTRIPLLGGAALLMLALPLRAQNTTVDSRWVAFLGCWEPVQSLNAAVCVVPAGTNAVDLLAIEKGEVVSRERIAATGERTATTGGDCTGSQTAEWSAIAVRVYLHSTETCAGALTRDGTGIIAMTGTGKGEWVYIQGVTIAGAAGQTGVRVQRYREASDDLQLPAEVSDALKLAVSSTMRARAAALAPLAINDVVDASHKVDAAVIQAWLVERGRPFLIDAKKLVALADAGVPSSVIDLIVALSYPKAFAINGAAHQGERLTNGIDATNDAMSYRGSCASFFMLDPFYDCGYGYGGYGYGRYGYGYDPYGYGYDYPVIIIYNPSGGGGGSGGTARQHGRVVNGQGYLVGNNDDGRTAQPRSSQPASNSGSSSSPSSSSSSSGSSSNSGGERTAHRRP